MSYISVPPHAYVSKVWPHETVRDTHQSLSDGHKPLNVQLILAQIEHLQRPISFQNLRDVRDAGLQ